MTENSRTNVNPSSFSGTSMKFVEGDIGLDFWCQDSLPKEIRDFFNYNPVGKINAINVYEKWNQLSNIYGDDIATQIILANFARWEAKTLGELEIVSEKSQETYCVIY